MLNSIAGFPDAAAMPAPLDGTPGGVRIKFSIRVEFAVEVEFDAVSVGCVPVKIAPEPVVFVLLAIADVSVMVPVQSLLTL
jgi:hypothetical protein